MSEIKLLLAEIQTLKRRIQALETVEEHPGYAASDVARLSQNNTFAGIQTIPNTGLHILDTDGSHDLIIAPGSNLSADVTLSLVMTANRTLTLSGNLTVPATGTAALLGTANVFTADQAIGDGTGSQALILNGAAGTSRNLTFRTAGVNRWILQHDGTAESGSNAGSDLLLLARADDGSAVANVWKIFRATGNFVINSATDAGYKFDVFGQSRFYQSSTTGAIPPILLRQADVDQDIVEIVAGSSTGNATSISTSALGAYAGRIQATINGTRGWIPFYADA